MGKGKEESVAHKAITLIPQAVKRVAHNGTIQAQLMGSMDS